MADFGPDNGRRASDRASTTNVEAVMSKAQFGAPLVYRMLSSIGGVASTVILAVVGFAWSEVRDEWRDLKTSIAEIRKELDRQPSPEEFDKIRDKVDQINDRLIRLEAHIEDGPR